VLERVAPPDRPLPSAGAVPARRYAFVDLMRGVALIVMIETHVVNSYLPLAARRDSFFFWLSFVNGLVAPAFLFVSGFSAYLQASRQWESWISLRPPFWKHMRRLGFILLIAYYTHLQHFALSRYLDAANPGIWKASLRVDILQCIVASLLIVDVLILVLRTPRRFVGAAAAAAIAISLASPWIWAQDFTGKAPLALALFLNPHGASLFPLFPWACFVLAGAVMCDLFLRWFDGRREAMWARFAGLLGCGMIAAGLLPRYLPLHSSGQLDYFRTSPWYVMLRLGCVLLLCALIYEAERLRKWAPQWVRMAGQESRLVYGVHLWLLYAVLRGKHVSPFLGLQLGYAGCFGLSIGIIVFMLWLAVHWRRLKQNHPARTKASVRGAVAIMLVVFLLR
jgi:uncharacterized membrane protein